MTSPVTRTIFCGEVLSPISRSKPYNAKRESIWARMKSALYHVYNVAFIQNRGVVGQFEYFFIIYGIYRVKVLFSINFQICKCLRC